jgi:hypothetical protein
MCQSHLTSTYERDAFRGHESEQYDNSEKSPKNKLNSRIDSD